MSTHLIRTGLTLLLLCMLQSIYTQSYTIKGYITEQKTGEALLGANVFDEISALGTVTNNFGFYSITLPSKEVKLSFTYIGYNSQEINFVLNRDTTINIELSDNVEMEEVEVIADKAVVKSRETQIIYEHRN